MVQIKKKLFVIILFVFFCVIPLSVRATDIVDGDLIRASDNADVFIVKIVGSKRFKRLVLNPDIFNQYGHLKWGNIKVVDTSVVNEYTVTTLVRWVGSEKVYMLSPNVDIGTKHWINMTPPEFETSGFDWDSIYLINEHEYRSYTDGEDLRLNPQFLTPVPFGYGLIADINTTADILKLAELNVEINRLRPEVLSFAKTDLKNQGIDIMVLKVDSKPGYLPGVPPPTNFDLWANDLKALVASHPDITYWQVWNEPNEVLFWYPEPNAVQYSDLLKKSYTAIKQANPNAKVVVGGLSGINPALRQFLRDIYANGARNYFDILALHPYGQPNGPATYLKDYLYDIKNIMDANGDLGKPVWITEIGWPTFTNQFGFVPQETQAQFLQETYDIARKLPFVKKVFWYRLQDVNEGMGILGKPAEAVYKNLKSQSTP